MHLCEPYVRDKVLPMMEAEFQKAHVKILTHSNHYLQRTDDLDMNRANARESPWRQILRTILARPDVVLLLDLHGYPTGISEQDWERQDMVIMYSSRGPLSAQNKHLADSLCTSLKQNGIACKTETRDELDIVNEANETRTLGLLFEFNEANIAKHGLVAREVAHFFSVLR